MITLSLSTIPLRSFYGTAWVGVALFFISIVPSCGEVEGVASPWFLGHVGHALSFGAVGGKQVVGFEHRLLRGGLFSVAAEIKQRGCWLDPAVQRSLPLSMQAGTAYPVRTRDATSSRLAVGLSLGDFGCACAGPASS